MGYIGNAPYQGVLTGGNIQDGTVETTDLADAAVTTAKLHDQAVTEGKLHTTLDLSGKTLTLPAAAVTAHAPVSSVNGQTGAVTVDTSINSSDVTTALGYTPVNKAGDTMTGTLNSVGSHVQKVVTGGSQSGSAIKRVEEMINFAHYRGITRYFKVRVKQRYSADPMGCALTMTFGKFAVHAALSHWRTYKIAGGCGSGGDPTGWNMAWYIEKETAVGWNYYGTTFGFEIFIPNTSSASRDYFYIRLTVANDQGSDQSAPSFLHVDGFVGLSDLPLLVDMDTSQPSDWGDFQSLGSAGTW